MQITRLRGFRDIIGAEGAAMALIEERARALMPRYGITEIRIPVLEHAELYQRTTGETSDIVEKQMYVFPDRDDAQVALRPEGTPGVVRAYIEAGFDRSDPEQKWFYSGAVFRRERPQKGRYRQFSQFGVEVFGRGDPACDAELLVMIDELRRSLGLSLRFEINSIGDAECRPAFRAALIKFGREHWDELCEDCHSRLERNPLRMLDCKTDAKLAELAPKSIDYLCEPCRAHFAAVKDLIAAAGVKYFENPRLVRGLDYYTRTAFEVLSGDVGAQSAVVAGGRYDGLVEALGGAAVPGIGFAIGIDRLALAVEATGQAAALKPDAAIIAIGESAARHAIVVAQQLRAANLKIEMLSPERRLKALIARADKIGARFAVIVGEDELRRGVLQIRDLKKSAQREVAIADAASAISSGAVD